MHKGSFASQTNNIRLYDLLVRFQQGDNNCYSYIIDRFSWLIKKASYSSSMGMLDDDLQADIYLTLFTRLQQFLIQDNLQDVSQNIKTSQNQLE